MALWTSGIHSTRSVCVSSIGIQPVLHHWPLIMMAPCLQSPLPTCLRKETSATQRMPSLSARSQMPRQSPSESSSCLLCKVLLRMAVSYRWISEQCCLQCAGRAAAYADLYLCPSTFQYPIVKDRWELGSPPFTLYICGCYKYLLSDQININLLYSMRQSIKVGLL